jgi:hypothetical protein
MRRTLFRWSAGVLALGCLVGTCALCGLFAQDRPPTQPAPAPPPTQPAKAPPQDPYRVTRNVPGDAKPIILHADEVATWPEKDFTGDHLAVLLRGTVLVQQNVVQARFQQGFAWVDLRLYREAGLLHVLVYGEGETRVDNGLDVHEAPRTYLDLTTRGEFRLHSHKNKALQQSRADDPVAQRARAFGLGTSPVRPAAASAGGQPAPTPVQRTALQQPPPATATPATVPPSELPDFLMPGRSPAGPPR